MPQRPSSKSSKKPTRGAWEDILAPGLDVVSVGFNPSMPAWRTGHYYANPGNRFYLAHARDPTGQATFGKGAA